MPTIYHDGSWTHEELLKMAKGQVIDRNNKRYGCCRGCNKIVRLDKPFFGSMHICSEEEVNRRKGIRNQE